MEQLNTGKHLHYCVYTCIEPCHAMHNLTRPLYQFGRLYDKTVSVQLLVLGLNSNQLMGSLPVIWSKLTNVSHALVIQ